MNKTVLSLCITLFLLISPSISNGHFLWLVLNPTENSKSNVEIYFGEIAEPDDPELLSRLKDIKGFTLSASGDKKPLDFTLTDEALSSSIATHQSAQAICLNHTYGAMTRGENTFVLKYYAKTYSTNSKYWSAFPTAKHNALDIVPSHKKDDFTFKVLWKEKPLANAELKIYGDDLKDILEVKTDQNGKFECKLPLSGVYSIRAKHVENRSGSLKDKKYDSIRHYSTLVLNFTKPE